MDEDSERIFLDVPLPGARAHIDGSGLVVDHSAQLALCTLCGRSLAPEYEATYDLETVGLCGDCKFLLLEDLATPPQDSHRRRPARRRRNRQSSSESIENLFSEQFSQMINLVRHNQSTVSGLEDQITDGGSTARSLQCSSSRTTPSGSSRWQRVPSDSESDGFDNLDSIYGESESNFGGCRVFQGESDAISFSNYRGGSDASMDGHSFLDTEIFFHTETRSDIDSDTDIDPMHTGLSQWNWDEPQEDEGDEDGEWEEADAEEDAVEFTISRAGLRDLFISTPNETNLPVFNFRRSRAVFEQLLDTDGSRRGAPPASVSFVNNLPRVIVSDEHEKHDGLACAICKDVLPVGIEVNQLPCLHVYHPSCILPWLSARNSCPLCRYELPTDDKDYEKGKQPMNNRMQMHEIQQQDPSEDSSSDDSHEAEAEAEAEAEEACELGPCRSQEVPHVVPTISSSAREGGRDWLFCAAAPFAGIIGVVLVLWLGKPLIARRGSTSHCNLSSWGQHQIQVSDTTSPNQRGSRSRSRRWWSLF